MAESSINHCLVLAHLPSVFCIPRHHFQSLPPNWGEWQSGSKKDERRRAYGAEGGWPHSKANPAEKMKKGGIKEEERRVERGIGGRSEDYHLEDAPLEVCFTLHFLPFANSSFLTFHFCCARDLKPKGTIHTLCTRVCCVHKIFSGALQQNSVAAFRCFFVISKNSSHSFYARPRAYNSQ